MRSGKASASARKPPPNASADDAHPIDALDELMPTLLMDQPTLYAPLAGNRRADGRLRRWLAAARESGRGGRLPPERQQDVAPFWRRCG